MPGRLCPLLSPVLTHWLSKAKIWNTDSTCDLTKDQHQAQESMPEVGPAHLRPPLGATGELQLCWLTNPSQHLLIWWVCLEPTLQRLRGVQGLALDCMVADGRSGWF